MVNDEKLQQLRRPAQPGGGWQNDPATERQVNYIKALIEDRIVPQNWIDKIRELADQEGGLKKGKAGEIISALRGMQFKGTQDRSKNSPDPEDVPAGRYCIQTGDDEEDLSFFSVWRPKDNPRIVRVRRVAGPNEYPVRSGKPTTDIIKAIYRAGAGEAAIRYGQKIGKCSTCNRRLTKRISRFLGIGPICGGRFWDDWEERVNKARASLLESGLDPDENLNQEGI